MMVIEFWCFFA